MSINLIDILSVKIKISIKNYWCHLYLYVADKEIFSKSRYIKLLASLWSINFSRITSSYRALIACFFVLDSSKTRNHLLNETFLTSRFIVVRDKGEGYMRKVLCVEINSNCFGYLRIQGDQDLRSVQEKLFPTPTHA